MCEVPARYGDAVSGLRLRVFDPTENQLPDWVDSTEIGQHLRAVVTWGALVVPVELQEVGSGSLLHLRDVVAKMSKLTYGV